MSRLFRFPYNDNEQGCLCLNIIKGVRFIHFAYYHRESVSFVSRTFYLPKTVN